MVGMAATAEGEGALATKEYGFFVLRSLDTHRCTSQNMGRDAATYHSVLDKYFCRERGGTPSSWFEREAVQISFQSQSLFWVMSETESFESRAAE